MKVGLSLLEPDMSDFIPNSFQTPNDYVDQFMHLLTSEEWKVLTYTVRRIFGFQKRQDRISLSQYERGARDKDGHQLDHGTGLSRNTIVKALAALEKYGLQVMVEPNDKFLNEGACYALQLKANKVDVAGLEQRAAEAKRRGSDRTQKARELNPKHTHTGEADLLSLSDPPVSPTNHPPVSPTNHPPVSPTNQPLVNETNRGQLVPLTGPGKSDLPPLVSPTNSQYTEGNPGEIQGKHTHTAARATPASGNSKAQGCVCATPHRSKLCDAERIRIASNMPGVDQPERYAMTPEARRGTYDAVYLKRQKELHKVVQSNTQERDTSACPDCGGKGLYYPAGDTPEGRAKGLAKCLHPRLDEDRS